ncbi:hypothetical protein V6U90_08055 [Micromonospora sp. CPCC 206060]|uniref:hypothetical protein n=1 Tax=Micromonospora sp. CPCC 206060 TaxID=3122406 RepID=UPI002FF375F8
MNLEQVATELGNALRAIDGLSVPQWGVQRVHPPAAVVTLPGRVEYDKTYGRGADEVPEWQVIVLVANPTRPESRRTIAGYAAGSGPTSVKQAIEAGTYTACDQPRVTSAEFDVVTYVDVKYLAAIFTVAITGKGA